MENLALKIRLSMLWLFMAVATLADAELYLFEPGGIEKVTSGEVWVGLDPAGSLLYMALAYWFVPLVMALLSVTLKDSANRWANMILGIIFTGLNIFHLTYHLAEPSAHILLLVVSTIVVTALIAWYAWKWPKQKV